MRRAKPVRSALFVPGNREDRIRKAPRFGADALILDLEDAVALPDKPNARPVVRKMVEELGGAGQTMMVRVNDFETQFTWADLDAIICKELYCVMLPKVTGPEDVKRADTIIEFLERKHGIEVGTVLIYPVLETAQGMRQAYEVGIASPRVVHMGGLTGKDGDIARRSASIGRRKVTRPFTISRKCCSMCARLTCRILWEAAAGGTSMTSMDYAKKPF